MSPQHFLQKKKDWSARKHDVLVGYVRAFCRALSRQEQNKTIWYVDGYAGAGVFREDDDPNNDGEPGSPVLAARETQKLEYNIQCLNIEEDNENYQSLVRETAQFEHVSNIHADFNGVIDEVLERVNGSPAFFFLDPFGTKDLPMEGLIDRIAMRKQPTDILVRYATETVWRLAGAYENDSRRGPAHARNLDKWFKGQEWREIIERYPAGAERNDFLRYYYMDQLRAISGGRFRFAGDYPIRTIEGHIKYHLIFATGSPLGMKIMSEILYQVDSKFVREQEVYRMQKEEAKQAEQMSFLDDLGFGDQVNQDDRLEAIQSDLFRIALSRRNEWEFEALQNELIINYKWFGRMSEKEFRAICKHMFDQGIIERISEGKGWSRGTRFRLHAD